MNDVVSDPLLRRHRAVRAALAVTIYVFLLAPIAVTIPMAFGPPNALSFPPQTYSLDLFRMFFQSVNWHNSLAQSLRIAAVTVTVSMIAGVPAGYWLARHDFAGKKLVAGVIMSPMLVPHIVLALGLFLYFSYIRIAASSISIVLGHLIVVLPYVIIVVVAGVNKLDRNLEFGAELMGAGPVRMFCTIVLPQLVPTLFSAALFAFLLSFDEVTISWFLATPDTITLPVQMYTALQWELSPVIAAVAALLTGISLLVSIAAVALTKETPAA